MMRAYDKLKEFGGYQWFANVGQPLKENFIPVHTWDDALNRSRGDIWNSVQLQVKNSYARQVRQTNHDRSVQWNPITSELRKAIAVIVENSIKSLSHPVRLKQDLIGSVSWDLLMICLEAEFSDLVQPLFFVPRLEPIYRAGHFPCGWEGPKVKEGWEGKPPDYPLYVF
jgi:hypothetical protein